MSHELPDGQAGIRKSPGTRDQIANIRWLIKKARVPEKHLLLLYWLCQSLDCVDHNKLWKSEYQTTWPSSWEICVQVRKQPLELDMEQTGSKSGKGYVMAVYCHPAYLTYMQSTPCELLGWMKQKMESRLPGEISVTSYSQVAPPLWQKPKKN